MTLWRIRATVDDRPGFLAVLAASLALRSVNILAVQVHATEGGAVDDFLVDAPDALSESDLLAAVVKGRGREPWILRADADGLRDAPTVLIGLAARLINGYELGAALTELLGDVLVTWRPEPAPATRGFGAHIMLLPEPGGGTLEVRRLEPPFTPAEYARAHALVDLAATVVRQARSHGEVLLPDGAELTVRPARRPDQGAVRQLHDRWLPPRQGHALLAETPDRRVVALAHLTWDGPEAELDLRVAADWRRRGLGTALARRALRLAADAGRVAVHVHTHADNSPMIHTLSRLGLPLRAAADGALVTLSLDLTAGSGTPYPVP
jgi:GNAT superfamily N-acetyltransferase